MKKGVRRLLIFGLVAYVLFQFLCVFLPDKRPCVPNVFGGDLRLRRNEIVCAHQGVNSFRIWNREISLPGFTPYSRPDKEDVAHREGDAWVHAYPPWHTAMFYFYGWMSDRACIALMSGVFVLCLCFIFYESVCFVRERFEDGVLVVGWAMAMIAGYTIFCFNYLNYGILILAALLFMNKMLKKGHVIWAGLAWAVMMIKPQMGLLFVWPLFWHRKYVTIVTAAGVCLAATFVTSLLVHESMIDLILQVPQIGAPYSTLNGVEFLVRPFLGESTKVVVMVAFFIFTGFATWVFRKSDDFMLSCVPVVLAIPLWTYSQELDRVILFVAFLFMMGRMFTAKRFNKWVWIGSLYFVDMVCIYMWRLVSNMGLFDPTGKDIFYNVMTLLSQAFLFMLLLFLMCEELPRMVGLKKGE